MDQAKPTNEREAPLRVKLSHIFIFDAKFGFALFASLCLSHFQWNSIPKRVTSRAGAFLLKPIWNSIFMMLIIIFAAIITN